MTDDTLTAANRQLSERVAELEALVQRYAMCGHDHSTQWWQIRFEDLQRENERLREALGECIKTFDYLVFHRVPGMGPLLYESHNRTSPGRTVETAKRLAHQALSHARLSRPRRAS